MTMSVTCSLFLLEIELSWKAQEVCTLEYGMLNQQITAHAVSDRHNKYFYIKSLQQATWVQYY